MPARWTAALTPGVASLDLWHIGLFNALQGIEGSLTSDPYSSVLSDVRSGRWTNCSESLPSRDGQVDIRLRWWTIDGE